MNSAVRFPNFQLFFEYWRFSFSFMDEEYDMWIEFWVEHLFCMELRVGTWHVWRQLPILIKHERKSWFLKNVEGRDRFEVKLQFTFRALKVNFPGHHQRTKIHFALKNYFFVTEQSKFLSSQTRFCLVQHPAKLLLTQEKFYWFIIKFLWENKNTQKFWSINTDICTHIVKIVYCVTRVKNCIHGGCKS